MTKTKKVIVHLNDTVSVESHCSMNDKIEDIYTYLEKSKDISIDKIKYQLTFKDGLLTNLSGKITKDLELWMKPKIDVDEAIKKKIFGKSIEVASKRAKKGLPTVLSVCFKFLQSENALKSVGLFRLVGNKGEVEKYKAKFDSEEEFEFPDNTDPTVVSSLVLLYLEELPEPITSFKLFEKFIEDSKSSLVVEKLKNDLKLIPTMNYKILQFIIRYFVYQVKHTEENGANSRNLSLVFGKILFKHEKSKEKTEFKDRVMDLAQVLIDNYYEIFNVERPKEEEGKKEEKRVEEKRVEEKVDKAPDTGRKMVNEDISQHWQTVIEQWKEKYQKEVQERKKEKEFMMYDIESLQKQVEEFQAQIGKSSNVEGNNSYVAKEKEWIRKEKEYLDEIEKKR